MDTIIGTKELKTNGSCMRNDHWMRMRRYEHWFRMRKWNWWLVEDEEMNADWRNKGTEHWLRMRNWSLTEGKNKMNTGDFRRKELWLEEEWTLIEELKLVVIEGWMNWTLTDRTEELYTVGGTEHCWVLKEELNIDLSTMGLKIVVAGGEMNIIWG